MLHEKESCTHIMHIPQNILHLIDKTLYEKESHSHVQIPFRIVHNQIKCSMMRKIKHSCLHISQKHIFHKSIARFSIIRINRALICAEKFNRFFNNQIDKMHHQNQAFTTHAYLTDSKLTIGFTKYSMRIKHLCSMQIPQILSTTVGLTNCSMRRINQPSTHIMCRFDVFLLSTTVRVDKILHVENQSTKHPHHVQI
jgi:hypothetical protein